MKRTTLTVGLAILLMTVGFPAAGSGQSASASKTRGAWWRSVEVQQKLGLSQQQVEQIEAIETLHKENLRGARRNVASAVRKYVTALDAGAEASEILSQRQQELDQAWAQHLQVTTSHWKSLRSLLNEEQWLKLPEVAPKEMRVGILGVRQRVSAER